MIRPSGNYIQMRILSRTKASMSEIMYIFRRI